MKTSLYCEIRYNEISLHVFHLSITGLNHCLCSRVMNIISTFYRARNWLRVRPHGIYLAHHLVVPYVKQINMLMHSLHQGFAL